MSSSKVLEMNSKAVSLLLQGDHEISTFTLQRALEGFRSVLNEDTEPMAVQRTHVGEMDTTILHPVAINRPQHKDIGSHPSNGDNNTTSHAARRKSEREFTISQLLVTIVLLFLVCQSFKVRHGLPIDWSFWCARLSRHTPAKLGCDVKIFGLRKLMMCSELANDSLEKKRT